MLALVALLAFGAPVAVALIGRAFRPKTPDDQVDAGDELDVPETLSAKRQAFRRAVLSTGVGEDWLRFLEQVAKRESNFNPRAMNTSTKEAAAAKRSVDRNRERLEELAMPPDDWAFGSAGLFQFLGPVAALGSTGFRFPKGFINARGPRMAKDPGVAVATALSFARGLMRWGNYKDAWASLDQGWANPSKMGDAQTLAKRQEKIEDRAAQLGWARGWGMESPSPLPNLSPAELVALAEAATRAYGGANA